MSRTMSNEADFQAQIDAMRSDFTNLKGDLASLLRDAIAAGKAGTGEAREHLEDAVEQKLEQLNSAWHSAQSRGKKAVASFEESVAERPLVSVGTAFGVGVVIGILLGTSRR